MNRLIPVSKDKTLFTPGPLTTSLSVKQAMLHDAGSWHRDFNEVTARIRERLLALAGVSRAQGFECILMQGSGTFGVESVFASAVPPAGKVLVISNGAYGERMLNMLAALGIASLAHRIAEDQTPRPEAVEALLQTHADISLVAVVHCETTTGILNRVDEIGEVTRDHGCRYFVDAMSSFGAVPIDFEKARIDFLVSSPNKCLEGVPGFSFVIASREKLLANEGHSRSLSLDLIGQLREFERTGRFRYTPPTHAILACQQALDELELEGGVEARAQRYRQNHAVLVSGMQHLGFKVYLNQAVQSYIITSFYFPRDPGFEFQAFYDRLAAKGMIIYPGKISRADLFRIGSIGRIFESDIRSLLRAVRETLDEMEIKLPGRSC